jgi:hypothetical protein
MLINIFFKILRYQLKRLKKSLQKKTGTRRPGIFKTRKITH